MLHIIDLASNNFTGRLPQKGLTTWEAMMVDEQKAQSQFKHLQFEMVNGSQHYQDTVTVTMKGLEMELVKILTLFTSIDLSSNNFRGSILEELGFGISFVVVVAPLIFSEKVNLCFSSFPPNIRILKLASCKLVMIPNLKNCSSIDELDLSVNQISGEIPNWIWEVAGTNLNLSHNSLVGFQEPYSIKNLRYLDLHSNRLQGKIPLPPLEARVVDYSSNNFTSSIPDDIGNIAFLMQFFSVSNNKLTGVIPESLCNATRLNVLDLSINNLSGRIPTCLIEMGENLGVLNVKRNNLYGTIPDRFPGNCGFQTLSMNSNQLEGLVPKSLANCTTLEVLDLGNNKINDAFPCWLKNVSSLHVLVLRSNKFYGNISCLEYDVSWPMLQIIDLASNNFTGRLPQKGLTTWEAMMVDEHKAQSQLTHLQFEMQNSYHEIPLLTFDSTWSVRLVQWNQSTDCCTWSGVYCDMAGRVIGLHLSEESICGLLPPSMGYLTRLEYLDLSFNNFTGPLPPSMGNLTQLEHLDLSINSFTGPLPPSMGNLTQLEYVDLLLNNFSGFIPSFHMSRSLNYLSLSSNCLTGGIASTDWQQLQDLSQVDLSFNFLNGSIPPSLFTLPLRENLQLSNNQFEGQIPEFLNAPSSVLYALDLSVNRLEGPIPMSIFELKNLHFLNLASNKFNGTVQLDVIGRLGNLTHFDLSYNNLAVNVNSSFSSFPPDIYSLKLASCKLVMIPNLKKISSADLDLSDNHISGEIPNWIWEVSIILNLSHNSLVGFQEPYSIKNLGYLDLHSNQLQGKIPLPPPDARVVDYSSNNFTSSIPDDIGNIALRMEFFSVSNNKLTGVIPESLCNATRLQVLDLSINNLSGRIPTSLIEMGKNLGVLNVRRNSLYGTIPDRFRGDCGLQTLSMNSNQLEGSVPKSLANCTKLEVLDLGNNNIRDAFPCWLKNVSSLHVLVLRSNKFYGNIDCLEYHVFWPMLQIIDLASNNFTGRLPQKGLTTWEAMMVDEQKAQSQLKHLQFQMAGENQHYQDAVTVTLKGVIPESICNATNLKVLDLSSNNLSGSIPACLIQRSEYLNDPIVRQNNLGVLNVRRNSLNGTISDKFPANYGLRTLNMNGNQLEGSIPKSLANCGVLEVLDLVGKGSLAALNLSHNSLVGLQEPFSIPFLIALDLHSNRLQGKIPPPPARYLDHSNNNFSNSIPHDTGNLFSMTLFFSLSNNKLTGVIPKSICEATYLQVLDLSSNNLSGSIPACLIQRSKYLNVLNVRRNSLNSTIPDKFPANRGLRTINMNGNHLEGIIPKSLANCRVLEVLDLGHNHINDAFPCWLKNVSSLHVLVLQSNRFNGNINCLEHDVSWPTLQIFDLGSNYYNGRLPQKGLTTWEAVMVDENNAQPQLEHLQFEIQPFNHLYYQDTVTVTSKGLEMELVKILTLFNSIDLSSNKFQG
ncbi:hypothetical protein LWI29_017110 [Acer saccharum]|uniref:Leucine-rich repeat-containing N-terminal plant-type domain-containing protein n=1 Tax=Acer saccharum TaxID=4024 RepID=A0AA39S5G2_ACESA|nr:hypothetical protein LWI29_017110 [Acer saccharum]